MDADIDWLITERVSVGRRNGYARLASCHISGRCGLVVRTAEQHHTDPLDRMLLARQGFRTGSANEATTDWIFVRRDRGPR